jgi:hypothetical protein
VWHTRQFSRFQSIAEAARKKRLHEKAPGDVGAFFLHHRSWSYQYFATTGPPKAYRPRIAPGIPSPAKGHDFPNIKDLKKALFGSSSSKARRSR